MSEVSTEPSSKFEALHIKSLPAAVAAGCIAVGSWKLGFGEVLDQQVNPGVSYMSQIVDGMVLANETLRTIGPAVLAYGLVETARHKLNARKQGNVEAAMIEHLSQQELTDTAIKDTAAEPVTNKVDRTKQLFKGPRRVSAVVASTLAFCGISAGLEHEISNGPERPQVATFEVLAPVAKDRTLIVQDKKITFMGTSVIPKQALDKFAAKATDKGMKVVPFKEELFNVNGDSSLVISIPDQQYESIAETQLANDCESASAIVDTSVTQKIGEKIDINGNPVRIAGKLGDVAQMNRSVAIMSDSELRACITHDSDQNYFGAVVAGATPEEVEQYIEKTGLLANASAISEQEFKASNREFWRKNGTPVLLITMGLAAGLGTLALAGKRWTALQNSKQSIAIMQAIGIDMDAIYHVEERRALREANKALVATMGMVGLAGVFNAAEKGLQVGVGVREVGVGYTLALCAQLVAGRRAVRHMEKNMNITATIKS